MIEKDFLKNFEQRMKCVGRYSVLCSNSFDKKLWKDYGVENRDEQMNMLFTLLLFIMEYSLREENCTMNEIAAFAQTNAEHLLKPLIEMAKKTNTQLICLSGLGGDSIYNRFDNIYVVKLLESSIRNGVQRVETAHVKGEEIKRLVLSDFRMEQVNMFDI